MEYTLIGFTLGFVLIQRRTNKQLRSDIRDLLDSANMQAQRLNLLRDDFSGHSASLNLQDRQIEKLEETVFGHHEVLKVYEQKFVNIRRELIIHDARLDTLRVSIDNAA